MKKIYNLRTAKWSRYIGLDMRGHGASMPSPDLYLDMVTTSKAVCEPLQLEFLWGFCYVGMRH